MTTAQVYAGVAVIITLIATWTGLMIAVALLLPAHARRASKALETSTVLSFVLGLITEGFLLIVGIVLFRLHLPIARLLSLFVFLLLGAIVSVGAAGLAHLMGRRIGEMAGATTSFGMLLRGSLVFSLAIGFPFIGWYLLAPICTICAVGAGVLSLFPERRTVTPGHTTPASQYDLGRIPALDPPASPAAEATLTEARGVA